MSDRWPFQVSSRDDIAVDAFVEEIRRFTTNGLVPWATVGKPECRFPEHEIFPFSEGRERGGRLDTTRHAH